MGDDRTALLALSRLITRLEHNLLSPAAEVRLRQSQYERKRVEGNIAHAQSLLLSLEKQSATTRVHAQKQQLQADLSKKRDAIKRLSVRLQELNELSIDESDEEELPQDSTQQETTNRNGDEERARAISFAPARSNVDAGLNIGEVQLEPTSAPPPTNELRARRTNIASDKQPVVATTARQDLFAGRKQNIDLETSDALMSHNTHEQEALTNGLLGLAQALKQSSLNFAASLESEKDVMKRAEGGLDKSSQGMEQAERKMGMLRRMSEGQGWWGRIKLYAFIAGLWVACFLLVFLGPKLRF